MNPYYKPSQLSDVRAGDAAVVQLLPFCEGVDGPEGRIIIVVAVVDVPKEAISLHVRLEIEPQLVRITDDDVIDDVVGMEYHVSSLIHTTSNLHAIS